MHLQIHQFATADNQSSVFAKGVHSKISSQSRIYVDLLINYLDFTVREHAGCECAIVQTN